MPKQRKKERYQGTYFIWLLGDREGVWQADGRSNRTNLGRHSLGTRDRDQAVKLVQELDLTKAVELGLADPSLLKQENSSLILLEEGCRKYLAYAARSPVMNGTSPGTQKRYKAVLDKFTKFANEKQVRYWQQVNKDLIVQYGSWLDDKEYKGRSLYLELTTIKQVIRWMVTEGMLPSSSLVTLRLKKPQGTDTYCYSRAEVSAIVELCKSRADLMWMADVVIALATTGLRIGELVELKWSNLDLERRLIQLQDASRRARQSERRESQTTKSHRDRTLNIGEDLLQVLNSLTRRIDGRVFHGPRGGKLKADTVRNVFKRDVLFELADRFPATLDQRGITAGRLHSFRHYFASVSADAGVPEQLLLSWLGHQEAKMLRHYYHLQQEVSRSHMSRIQFLGTAPSSAISKASVPDPIEATRAE